MKKVLSTRLHRWHFMLVACRNPSGTEQAMDSSCNFNLALAADHSFVQSFAGRMDIEKADAEKYNKIIKGVAKLSIDFKAYQESLRKGEPTSTSASLISLRDSAVAAKNNTVQNCVNMELQTIVQELHASVNQMLSTLGAVGGALSTDGVTFLLHLRDSVAGQTDECQKLCGGTQDGTVWHPAEEAVWDDEDALKAHFNRTVGQMQGPQLEDLVDKMVQASGVCFTNTK